MKAVEKLRQSLMLLQHKSEKLRRPAQGVELPGASAAAGGDAAAGAGSSSSDGANPSRLDAGLLAVAGAVAADSSAAPLMHVNRDAGRQNGITVVAGSRAGATEASYADSAGLAAGCHESGLEEDLGMWEGMDC